MSDLESIKREIESKERVLKQLEGVYKTSTDMVQKKRVMEEIRYVKKQINELMEIIGELRSDEGNRGRGGTKATAKDDYRILKNIPVRQYRNDHGDREMDTIISYMDFFEKNYLPILSEYYIKLDFNNSMKRDSYYIKFMDIKKILKEYNYELDILHNEEYNTIAIHRDKSIVYKIRHQYMLELDSFFKDLRNFLRYILNEYKGGGNVIMNPDNRIDLNEFEEYRALNGYRVVEALEEIKEFTEEIIRFLSIPTV